VSSGAAGDDRGVEIRRLTVPDAPAYRAFRLRGLREHPEAFTSSWEEDRAKPLSASEARLMSHQQRHWGAFVAGALHGIAGLELLARNKERHKGRVVGMYVAPESASSGLGAALLEAIVADARILAITDLVLTVTEGNGPAFGLYRKAGFSAFGTEPRAICVQGRYLAKVHMHASVG
jgi:ribosomal protein S18 acetylase RimI-like enzyme